ncbi:MAG: hypothetical protein AB1631_05895 [Acidobacteriota bacterium]
MKEEENEKLTSDISAAENKSSTRRETVLILILASALSISASLYFFNRGMTNVYGDGVAHANIARKVVDSLDDSIWQRYIQIGTPWLPLQTALMLPLVANDYLWRTGAAGSLISMIFYVITALSLYKLACLLYSDEDERYKKAMPAIACAIFLFNPSALYMQSTPMTEIVFMGAVTAGVFFLQRWALDQTLKGLLIAAVVMTVATLSRYEAWPVAAISILIVAIVAKKSLFEKLKLATLFALVVMIGPAYWLWHNWMIFGDAFEFLTGPHSARGIFLQNQANLGWSRIFVGNALLDVLLMSATVAVIVGPLIVMIAAGGFFRLVITRRKAGVVYLPSLLLLAPFFFHTLSLYRGEIQIFPLSAFGLLNVRYGLPHLLAVALLAPAIIPALRRLKNYAPLIVWLVVALQYWALIAEGPSQMAIYQEGFRNGVNSRPSRERARVASYLRENPSRPVILMMTGSLGACISQGGLRFSDIIHEGTSRWHAIETEIPVDVSTIILEEGDSLDRRISERSTLTENFKREFQQVYSLGRIKIYWRR